MASREKPKGWLSRITKRGGGAPHDDAAKAAHERRREQIRRAQRTHRERKEFYIKNIEAEVVTLREKDVLHSLVVIGLKRKISDLNHILIANGIAVPPELFHIDSPQATIAVQMQNDGVQNVRATMPNFTPTDSPDCNHSHSDTVPHSTTTATNSEISDLVSTYDKMMFVNGNQIAVPLKSGQGPSKSQSRGHPYDLNSAQVAVDFVLDLERPCLSHHGPDLHDGEFNGHRLMVQTSIMASSSTPGAVCHMKPGSKLSEDATWTVPAVEVERLLNLSSRLSLEGELTPIEAWQKIKQHPAFGTLDRGRLQQLKAIILPEVQCYGFGAVIDEQYFNFLVEQYLTTANDFF